MVRKPTADRTRPSSRVNSTIMEKVLWASSLLPSPSSLDTRAVPPVPIIKPMPPRIMMKGMTKLMAAKGGLTGEVGDEQAVHHAVDGREDHHADGGAA